PRSRTRKSKSQVKRQPESVVSEHFFPGHCDRNPYLSEMTKLTTAISFPFTETFFSQVFGGVGLRAVCSEPAPAGHGSGFDWQRHYGRRHCRHALHRHGCHAFDCGIPVSPSSCDPTVVFATVFSFAALMLAFDLREETRGTASRKTVAA